MSERRSKGKGKSSSRSDRFADYAASKRVEEHKSSRSASPGKRRMYDDEYVSSPMARDSITSYCTDYGIPDITPTSAQSYETPYYSTYSSEGNTYSTYPSYNVQASYNAQAPVGSTMEQQYAVSYSSSTPGYGQQTTTTPMSNSQYAVSYSAPTSSYEQYNGFGDTYEAAPPTSNYVTDQLQSLSVSSKSKKKNKKGLLTANFLPLHRNPRVASYRIINLANSSNSR